MVGRIIGTGRYVPENIVTNEDLAKIVDTSHSWIYERTGIVSRHLCTEDSVESMAIKAGKRALESSGLQKEEIDLVLVATCSGGYGIPSVACKVQQELELINSTAFDMNAACAGFLVGYTMAQAYIQSGMYKNILLIGSEHLSKIIDWQDRSTCILFGDGAGAIVLGGESGKAYLPVTHSDGSGWENILIDEGNCLRMRGQEVFRFALSSVPKVIEEVLDKNGWEIDEVDWFILHQANLRIIEGIGKRLKVDSKKLPSNVRHYGNTSAASIPILLDEMNQAGMLKSKDKIVIAGFGAGLTWGSACLEWK